MTERHKGFCIAVPAAGVLFSLAIGSSLFSLVVSVAALTINIIMVLYVLDP